MPSDGITTHLAIGKSAEALGSVVQGHGCDIVAVPFLLEEPVAID